MDWEKLYRDVSELDQLLTALKTCGRGRWEEEAITCIHAIRMLALRLGD